MSRTKRLLKEALLELILERGYERISIRDITEHADVGRSTFYSHFASKEDLLFDGFDHWLLSRADADGPAETAAERPLFRFSRPFLEHIGHQRKFFHAFMGHEAGARIRRKTFQIVAETVRRELERLAPDLDADREARVQLVVGAFSGLAAWWVDDGCRMPAAEVDRIFQSVAAAAIAG